MLAITRVSFKAVPLAWICSRLFCGDLNNLRVEAQVEPACSPFSFRIQNARLKWRLFLCKQTCHIPCKLSDNKKLSLSVWKWNSTSLEFLLFVHQTKRLMIPLCFNYSTSPNWDFAQASGGPDPNWVFVKLHSTYPDSRFCETCPHGDLFSDSHIGISIPREHCLQLLKLIRGEVRPLSSLLSFLLQPIAIHGSTLCRTKRKQHLSND